jgi:hypothetical protein
MTSAHPSIVAPMALNMRIDTWDTDDEHPDHPNQTGRSWAADLIGNRPLVGQRL